MSFEAPLTQELIADALGLTTIHVNRTLRCLRQDKLVEMDGKKVTISPLAAVRFREFLPRRRRSGALLQENSLRRPALCGISLRLRALWAPPSIFDLEAGILPQSSAGRASCCCPRCTSGLCRGGRWGCLPAHRCRQQHGPMRSCAPTLRRWYVEANATVAVRMLTLRAPIWQSQWRNGHGDGGNRSV